MVQSPKTLDNSPSFRTYPTSTVVDGDFFEDDGVVDALDVDREDDDGIDACGLPDPTFELVRQAYPNRPRAFRR